MLAEFCVWWHERRFRHRVDEVHVSVPLWDISARGVLYRCQNCDWCQAV